MRETCTWEITPTCLPTNPGDSRTSDMQKKAEVDRGERQSGKQISHLCFPIPVTAGAGQGQSQELELTPVI